MEFAIISRFDPQRGYGFADVLDGFGNRTGAEIFFHWRNGEFVTSCADGAPTFSGRKFMSDGVERPRPLAGRKIVFQRRPSPTYSDKDSASPWSFAESWEGLSGRVSY